MLWCLVYAVGKRLQMQQYLMDYLIEVKSYYAKYANSGGVYLQFVGAYSKILFCRNQLQFIITKCHHGIHQFLS